MTLVVVLNAKAFEVDGHLCKICGLAGFVGVRSQIAVCQRLLEPFALEAVLVLVEDAAGNVALYENIENFLGVLLERIFSDDVNQLGSVCDDGGCFLCAESLVGRDLFGNAERLCKYRPALVVLVDEFTLTSPLSAPR